ncbi:hypothetical protein HK100_002156 [Physocladia obscura]|uniref:Uncharacterized protein n=1 Tax=Physocladia obscura TaxID=109957 RepID=A0AAD5T8W6_9FUNG|nr:hypothetical protein HK100_002156 [Physocladia obscura]
MGDTSSGKSSLLSAISGIDFPSNSELTTRCPTRLVLSHAPEFFGQVRIVRHAMSTKESSLATTQNDDSKSSARKDPISIASNTAEGHKYLKSPNEIVHEIKHLTNKILENSASSISDDFISIEVSGPTYPNLTLIDLPGIIRTVDDAEDESMIQRVRDLVLRYVKQKRTVILAVVPANVDMHNVEILQLAEDADPGGERTIAIITKPDLVDPGAEKPVIELLLNKKKNLHHGYHCVKLRGQRDLNAGVTIAKSLDMESEFFASRDVWKDVQRDLVGIDTLTPKLVEILQDVIEKSLPSVIGEIDQKLSVCAAELERLGDALDSDEKRRMFHTGIVENLNRLITGSLNGFYNDNFFHDENSPSNLVVDNSNNNKARAIMRKHEDTFRDAILNTNVSEAVRKKSSVEIGEYVEVKYQGGWRIVDVKDEIGDGIISVSAGNNGQTLHTDDWRFINSMDLSQLKRQIAINRGDELAVFPSYNLFKSLVRSFVNTWKEPVLNLLFLYDDVLSKVFTNILDASLDSQQHGKMKRRIKQIFTSVFQDAKETTKTIILNALENECRPYTLNTALYQELVKLRNEPLMTALENLPIEKNKLVSIDAVKAVMLSFGIGASNEDREAMELQLAVKAYIKVAKTRFVDTAPMLLEQHYVQNVVKNIKSNLLMMSDTLLESILQEPAAVVKHRKNEQKKYKSLSKAKEEISNINVMFRLKQQK